MDAIGIDPGRGGKPLGKRAMYAQRRDLIGRLLRSDFTRTNASIAEEVGGSETVVSDIRHGLEKKGVISARITIVSKAPKVPVGKQQELGLVLNGATSGPPRGGFKSQGKGHMLAAEAINLLLKIPFNDPTRVEAMERVAQWIDRNK